MARIAEVKKAILELFEGGTVGWIDYILIMEKTDFRLQDIIKACEELEAEGKISSEGIDE